LRAALLSAQLRAGPAVAEPFGLSVASVSERIAETLAAGASDSAGRNPPTIAADDQQEYRLTALLFDDCRSGTELIACQLALSLLQLRSERGACVAVAMRR
jgi:hypothetical protein